MDAAPAAPIYRLYCGVDIAARSFCAAWLTPAGQPVPAKPFVQTPEDFTRFQTMLLEQHAVPSEILVVMEATGTYWGALTSVLAHAGFAVNPVNPSQAHNFIKALPKRAKTDCLDAQALALLAHALTPATWTPPPAI